VLEAEFQTMPLFKAAVIARIGELQSQGRGNKAVSVNTYLRCLKTFMRWADEERIVKEPFKLAWLKEEQKIPQRLRRNTSRNWFSGSRSTAPIHAFTF
jgi:hypothetical protein